MSEGQGQGAVTGKAGCEDGAGLQDKEGKQPLEVEEGVHSFQACKEPQLHLSQTVRHFRLLTCRTER